MARFARGRNVLARCRCCKKLTHSSLGGVHNLELCNLCNDSALQQNTHSDSGHPVPCPKFCPTCAGVDCLHEVLTQSK